MLKRILPLLIFAFVCSALVAQQTVDKSDRDKARLAGPVATIKVESTYFKLDNGKRVESERRVYEQSEYDKSGKLLNQKRTPMYGDPAPCQLERKYDEKHRLTDLFCQGSSDRPWRKYAYEDDRFGNWIKQTSSVPDGTGFRVQSTVYRTITYFE